MDLRCTHCRLETTYGEAQLTDRETSCEGEPEYSHEWREINQYDQVPGDAWKKTKDAGLWATHELKCTECQFMFLVAYGAKAKALRTFGGVMEDCPKCETYTPCIESTERSIETAIEKSLEKVK